MDDRAASILGGLARRAAQIRAEQLLPLAVPRWEDPKVIVKCRPLTNAAIVRGMERIASAKRDRTAEVALDVNADLLIEACEAIVAVIDGVEYSLRQGDPNGEPTTFDPDLAESLGMERDSASARQVVRRLFITDLDLTASTKALMEWSGAREQDVEALLAGE